MMRFPENPLITPVDVAPSFDGFEVVGTFNAAAFEFEGRIGLWLRYAERPLPDDLDRVTVPVFDVASGPRQLRRISLRRDDPNWDFQDPRVVVPVKGGHGMHHFLTNVSHFRPAWSTDGRHFEVAGPDEGIWPQLEVECFSIEDPRITRVEDRYVIAYTAVSPTGVCPALMTTPDFKTFQRLGVVLPLENKDVCLFPERVDGNYVMLHRPASPWCHPGIWIAYSRDLIHWGQHAHLAGPRDGMWDEVRIGAGPPPIRTPQGWLVIYHGVGDRGYCTGAMLLDAEHPGTVIARSEEPLMVPETDYERGGFFNDVVFCTGLVERPGGELWLYYGGADRVTAGCSCTVDEILSSLT
jgi:beta-1,2-mannobiose phosphorylase / 1,2-beta-oligomannan phosphorylase